MTLNDIHEAIKPQFIWSDHNCKDLQTDPVLYKGAGSKGIASIVFIGVAFMNGYKPQEIAEYLNIEYGARSEYFNKLNLFKKAMQTHATGRQDKQSEAIHRKTSLTLNYLKLQKKSEFLPLSSFQF